MLYLFAYLCASSRTKLFGRKSLKLFRRAFRFVFACFTFSSSVFFSTARKTCWRREKKVVEPTHFLGSLQQKIVHFPLFHPRKANENENSVFGETSRKTVFRAKFDTIDGDFR